MPHPPATTDEYLANVASDDARQALTRLRQVIREVAPDAEETISYGMPGFKQAGYLVGFAAFKEHCSFFPGTAISAFADRLEAYQTSKGTIRFTPDKPLPESLVRDIVLERLRQNLAKKQGVSR